MAAYYYGGSEVQAEGMQTLHLMNAGFIRYPDGQAGPAALAPANCFVVDAAASQENGGGFAGIQIAAAPGAHLTPDSVHLFSAPHDAAGVLEFMSRLQYASPWPPVESPAGAAVQSVIPAGDDDGRRAHHHLLQRGLSLRLSTQGPDQYSLCQPEQMTSAPGTGLMSTAGDDHGKVSPSSSGVSEGIAGVRGILMGSKYLKVARELLDEVVSMGSVAEEKVMKGDKPEKETTMTTSRENPTPGQVLGGGKQGAQLTTSERQELLMKKAKLVSLLDEVEQRYRQYRQQMQMVVTVFDAAAGVGSAKPYTALALRTISRQFRRLRDAISGQIRATGQSLGEEVGGSRLKLVDNRLRQQRALQQLGMMQHNVWRPQRGLPEKSVSILRAWLFENFLHPYPKDADKTMLAKQTGLTRSQVSNWFINARVRLWKPMVEEMYTEEMKDQEQNQSNHDQELPVSTEVATSSPDQEPSPPEAEQMNNFQSKMGFIEQNNFHPPETIDEELDLETNLKKRRNDASLINNGSQFMDLKPSGANNGEPSMGCSFNTYQQIGDMGRFDPQQFTSSFGNGVVSLTLGLPQLSGAQQAYVSNQNCMVMGRRIQIENEETDFFGMGAQQIVPDHASATGYEKLDIQNRKPFAAQLLRDFVV